MYAKRKMIETVRTNSCKRGDTTFNRYSASVGVVSGREEARMRDRKLRRHFSSMLRLNVVYCRTQVASDVYFIPMGRRMSTSSVGNLYRATLMWVRRIARVIVSATSCLPDTSICSASVVLYLVLAWQSRETRGCITE